MSLSIVNSTNVPLLDDDVFLGSAYDNIVDFAQITISIKCDTGYILTYIYSQNKVDIDLQFNSTDITNLEMYKNSIIDLQDNLHSAIKCLSIPFQELIAAEQQILE